MATTLPIVAAPQATAPAARPARAAAAGGAAPASGFEALLAESTAGAAPSDPVPSGALANVEAVPEEAGDRQQDAVAVDVWAFIPVAPQPWDAEPAKESGPTDSDDDHAVIEAAFAVDGHDVVEPAGSEPLEAAPVVAPPSTEPSRAPQGATEPAAPAPAAAAQPVIQTPIETPAEPVEVQGSTGATASVEGPTTAAAPRAERERTPGSQASPASTVARRAVVDPAKAAARSAVAHAVAQLEQRDTRMQQPANRETMAVATPALTPSVPVTAPAVAARSAASAEQLLPDVAGADAPLTELASAAAPAARNGTSRQGPRDEQSQAGWGRGASQERLGAVPASMVFPGHAGFAAALDHASPMSAVAQAATPFVPPGVGPQIVRAVHMQVVQGGGEMTLTLRPEHLGTVTVEVKVDQQRVVATLVADTPAVRGWVAAHESDLRSGLADLGLQLDELVVRDEDRRRESSQDRPTPERRKQQPASDEEVEFEIPL